jgi:peptidyl-prolyl cis-trans isomerase B (cyclophilin B)
MTAMRRLVLLGLLLVVVALVAGCGGDETATTAADETTTSAAPDSSGCKTVEAPAAREDGSASAPTDLLKADATYTLTVETNCGTFVITLDQKAAPRTAASLVQLARDGFFDDTVFHRIVPDFVIQGGDPTQSGSGGPGYSTVDAPPADAKYVRGVVAMAKTAAEPSGTSGSQFFVVTGDDIGLPADYAIVGAVTEGQAVVDAIGELGDPATEEPLQPIVISHVTVGEK